MSSADMPPALFGLPASGGVGAGGRGTTTGSPADPPEAGGVRGVGAVRGVGVRGTGEGRGAGSTRPRSGSGSARWPSLPHPIRRARERDGDG